MKIREIERKARGLGKKIGRMKKADLIRQIQKDEGDFYRFGPGNEYCDQWNCYFREECLSKFKT